MDVWMLVALLVPFGYIFESVLTVSEYDEQMLWNVVAVPYTALGIFVLKWLISPQTLMLVELYYIGVFLAVITHRIPNIEKSHDE